MIFLVTCIWLSSYSLTTSRLFLFVQIHLLQKPFWCKFWIFVFLREIDQPLWRMAPIYISTWLLYGILTHFTWRHHAFWYITLCCALCSEVHILGDVALIHVNLTAHQNGERGISRRVWRACKESIDLSIVDKQSALVGVAGRILAKQSILFLKNVTKYNIFCKY